MLGRGAGHGELGVLRVRHGVVEVVLVIAGGDGRHGLGVVGEGAVLGAEGKGRTQGRAGRLVPAEPGQAGVTTKARVNITPRTMAPRLHIMYEIFDFLHFPARNKMYDGAAQVYLISAGKSKKSEMLYTTWLNVVGVISFITVAKSKMY